MCRIKITFGSQKSRSTPLDQEQDLVRPISFDTSRRKIPNEKSAMLSGVYMHSASLSISRHNSFPQCTTPSPGSSKLSSDGDFVDHYSILGLDCWATSEEIKQAFRQFRSQFFSADLNKYRALQSAYDVLVDVQARYIYDTEYRSRKGLPVPRPRTPSIVIPRAKSPILVKKNEEEGQTTKYLPAEIETVDPNAVLKGHKIPRNAMIGTRPYASFIPILDAYNGSHNHPHLLCRMPEYILKIAIYSQP